MKKVLHNYSNQKRAMVVIFITDKIDFKPKTAKKDKKKIHYIIIKGSTHQQDIIIIYKYAHNIIALKYMKQTPTELKREIIVHNNSKGFQYSTFSNG